MAEKKEMVSQVTKDGAQKPANPMELVQLLRNKTVYIQTHNCPDPDAIASAYGMQEFLKAFGISSTCCYMGALDRISASRLLDMFQIEMYFAGDLHILPEDAIVLVDSQKLNNNVTDLTGDEVACVDHHPIFIAYDYPYSDIRIVGACASIIASYYKECHVPISPKVATVLTYGIKMDTADLSRGVTQRDLDMLAFLCGGTDWDLLRVVNTNRLNFDDLKAYGEALRTVKVYDTTGFAFIPFACMTTLVAIISDFILSLDAVDVAIVYALQANCIRLSVRSEDPSVHAGSLIRKALEGIGDGGGHAVMAGGTVERKYYDQKGASFEQELRERFMDAEKKLREEANSL